MKKVYLIGITGLFFIGLAVFAKKLGLDNDIGWGRKRLLIAQAGVIMVFASLFLAVFRKQLEKIIFTLSEIKERFSKINPITRSNIFTFVTAVLVMGILYWYVLPCFNNPKQTFDYYAKQGLAFKHGQLYLLDKPAPELLALSDPYNDHLRRISGVHDLYLIDASLYRGKYYLYWGPAPSLFRLHSARIRSPKSRTSISVLYSPAGCFYTSYSLSKTSGQNSTRHYQSGF
jgi:hypothetical protein